MERPPQVNEKTNLHRIMLDNFLNDIRGYIVAGFEELSGEELENMFIASFEKTEGDVFEARLQQAYALFSAELGKGDFSRLTRVALFAEPILSAVCDRVMKSGNTKPAKIIPMGK